MALSPLVQAVEHFPLAQLIADPNLCRNVLNDIGAQPAEVFLLVAALEARIPQTLIEHSATNDLSVVEPRLVAELNQRGVERSRAEWAVNAWKEVIGESTHETVMRPSSPVAARPTEPATVRPSQPVVAPVEAATVRPSQPATARPSEPATVRSTAPMPPAPPLSPAAAGPPPVLPPPTPPPGERRRRKGVIILAAAVVVLLLAGLGIWLGTRSSGKHGAAGPTSSGSSTKSSAPSTAGSTPPSSPSSSSSAASSTPPVSSTAPPANLNAPLGAPKNLSVAGTAAWTDTGLIVTQGERVNVVATGQIGAGPGQTCGPDGIPGPALDVYSIIGGGHTAGLIGLVGGSGIPFYVGSNYNNVAPASGHLYLGVNDTGVDNNSGKFTVTLRLQQS